jgi:hypothetical protein
MPYARKWIPAVAAVAHVIRADGCDRSAAMRQIESAVREGAFRWAGRGRKRWDWDAEVLQADLVKLWPQPPDEADSVGDMEAAVLAGDLREGLERRWIGTISRFRIGLSCGAYSKCWRS